MVLSLLDVLATKACRKFQLHPGSFAYFAVDGDVPAQALSTLTHDVQPEVKPVLLILIASEADTVVLYRNQILPVLLFHLELNAMSMGMLAYIYQRFLHDMKYLYLLFGGQIQVVGEIDEIDIRTRLIAEIFHDVL